MNFEIYITDVTLSWLLKFYARRIFETWEMIERFSNHSKADTDWFAHNVGYSLIVMGKL